MHANKPVIKQSSEQNAKFASLSQKITQYWSSSGLISHVPTVVEFF